MHGRQPAPRGPWRGRPGDFAAASDRLHQAERFLEQVRLSTTRGALVMRVKFSGEVQGQWLFVPWKRAVKADAVIWGIPKLTDREILLQDVQLAMQSDDRLVDLVTAMKRSDFAAVLAAKLVIPREKVEAQAREALAKLASGVDVAGIEGMPRLDRKVVADRGGIDALVSAHLDIAHHRRVDGGNPRQSQHRGSRKAQAHIESGRQYDAQNSRSYLHRASLPFPVVP